MILTSKSMLFLMGPWIYLTLLLLLSSILRWIHDEPVLIKISIRMCKQFSWNWNERVLEFLYNYSWIEKKGFVLLVLLLLVSYFGLEFFQNTFKSFLLIFKAFLLIFKVFLLIFKVFLLIFLIKGKIWMLKKSLMFLKRLNL